MTVLYTDFFKKRFQALPLKIQKKFSERMTLFLKNPFHPLLKNHPLQGNALGKRAFSVTGNYRAIYSSVIKGTMKFIDIGTHAQVY
ncbi:type II toxin-antitoxin system mRNA interferase toxin, RelE/StbE family [Candidatus Peregrinibacteria bacterium]|nr:type II toxin-antitoxin system mRNA interferase toxin, RelE/StbE family [Candidatus Peregrinibacteria bacterium]